LAAEQDKSPIIAVLHANYGAGYLWALKDIASSEQVKSATGQDMLEIERYVTKIQDRVTMHATKICPKYGGQTDKLMAALAGE